MVCRWQRQRQNSTAGWFEAVFLARALFCFVFLFPPPLKKVVVVVVVGEEKIL